MSLSLLLLAAALSPIAAAGEVVAHFMVRDVVHQPSKVPETDLEQVENSYSYTQDTWAADFAVAQSIGIDGFGTSSLSNHRNTLIT